MNTTVTREAKRSLWERVLALLEGALAERCHSDARNGTVTVLALVRLDHSAWLRDKLDRSSNIGHS